MKFELLCTLQVLLVIVLVTPSDSESLKFEDCGSMLQSITMSLTNCTASPCLLHRGQVYDYEVNGISDISSERLTYIVQATTILFPFTIVAGNACKDVLEEGTCPIEPGQLITFKALGIKIPERFPAITANLKAIVRDDHENILGCATLVVKIV